MSCLDEDAVTALLGGQIDPDGLRAADAHMATCADCRRLVSTLAAGASPAVDEELGRVVAGRFQLESVAGRGGMGRVYCARDLETGARVALKRVTVDDDRFAREARILADLAHPAIVRHVADGFDEGGGRYLVMEWLDGEDLAQRLARGPLSVEDTIVLGRRVAAALGAAHAHGVIHRDVKPSNVFLPEGRVDRAKVVDFGLARMPVAGSVRTLTGAFLGTLGYVAPEQARGEANVRPSADVFSLGCVLYECLTGERAYAGGNAIAILSRLLTSKPPRPRAKAPNVPRAFDGLVARMLARDPAVRPRNGAEVDSDLAALGSIRALLRPSHALFVAGVLGGCALVVVGGTVAARSRSERVGVATTLSATTEASTSGEGGPRAITDFPAPAGTPPAAAAEYQAGLDAIRDAALRRAVVHLGHAVEIDPTLAPAHLRLALWTDTVIAADESRAHYQAARANAHRLAPRDRELMEAVETGFLVEPPDLAEAGRRLAALAMRRPNDAELVLGATTAMGTKAEAEYFDRAIRLDPKFGYAWWGRANAQFRINDTAAARVSVDKCLEAAPGSTLCVLLRTRIDAREGRCEEMERDARLVIALENGGDVGYVHLANALAARGADPSAVREAIRSNGRAAKDEHARAVAATLDEAQLAIAGGDLALAERHARALEDLVKDEPFEQPHVRAAVLLVDVLEERGDDAGAGRAADAFLRRRPAWRSIAKRPNDDPVPMMLAAAMRAGLRSPADVARERTAWASFWREKLGTAAEQEIWLQAWARPAWSALELTAAIDAMPEATKGRMILPTPPGWILPQGLSHAYGGRLQALAGHPQEAVATLEAVTRHCAVLSDAVAHRRAALWLGQAYEASGEIPRACEAYATVLRHWGHARPASMTASAARARVRALRCEPPAE